ncbi:MAG: sigma-70 family RNA polymerase sigma factor [Terracidiphilus sp.]
MLTTEQERVLLDHLPVVRFIARRIHERLPQHVEMEDLVSAGVVGLMDAFTKFDAAKKVQFRSYAQFRIRGAILDSLRTLDWSPRELRRKGRAVEEAIRMLTARLGRAPGEGEISVQMGTSLDEYQQLLGDLKGLEIGTLHIERNENSGEEGTGLRSWPSRWTIRCFNALKVSSRIAWAAQFRVSPTASGW